MEPTLSQMTLKSVLAKNIDVKDTLDYALYGLLEPSLFFQFLLLGPIFSGFKTHRYFVGVTTSGVLFVEVNSKFEEKNHQFYKYYEIDDIIEKRALKGRQVVFRLRNKKELCMVFPRIVLGLSSQEDDIEAGIRVIHEKIKSSKEYFRNLKENRQNNSWQNSNYRNKSARNQKPRSRRRNYRKPSQNKNMN